MSESGFAKRWMTVPEVAAHFSCSRRFVYTLIETGKLSIINLGGGVGSRGIRIETISIVRLEQAAKIESDQYAE